MSSISSLGTILQTVIQDYGKPRRRKEDIQPKHVLQEKPPLIRVESTKQVVSEVDSLCASWRLVTDRDLIGIDPWVKTDDPWMLPPLCENASLGSSAS